MFQQDKKQVKQFGEYIFGLRITAHLSQQELAEKIGVTRQTIAKIENGQGAGVSLGTWLAVADVFAQEIKIENKTVTFRPRRSDTPVSNYANPIDGYDDWIGEYNV